MRYIAEVFFIAVTMIGKSRAWVEVALDELDADSEADAKREETRGALAGLSGKAL